MGARRDTVSLSAEALEALRADSRRLVEALFACRGPLRRLNESLVRARGECEAIDRCQGPLHADVIADVIRVHLGRAAEALAEIESALYAPRTGARKGKR